MRQYEALEAYYSEEADDLNFRAGEILTIIQAR